MSMERCTGLGLLGLWPHTTGAGTRVSSVLKCETSLLGRKQTTLWPKLQCKLRSCAPGLRDRICVN